MHTVWNVKLQVTGGNAMEDLEKKDEKTRQWRPYSCSQLSAFCLQISLLLEAAVPLDEGFSIMAEDAV